MPLCFVAQTSLYISCLRQGVRSPRAPSSARAGPYGSTPVSLPECPQAFRSSHHLKRHLQTHATPEPFACDVCAASFAKAFQLREHSFEHTNVPAFSCTFEGCEACFALRSEQVRHRRQHNRPRKRHVCERCNLEFAKITEMAKHMKDQHPNRFVCETCQKAFSTNARLTWHRKQHDPTNRVSCSQCPKTFSTQVRTPIVAFQRRWHSTMISRRICSSMFEAGTKASDDSFATLKRANARSF